MATNKHGGTKLQEEYLIKPITEGAQVQLDTKINPNWNKIIIPIKNYKKEKSSTNPDKTR